MKKKIPKFIISCEGETEVFYFNHLQNLLKVEGYKIEIKAKKQTVSSIIKSQQGLYSQLGEKIIAKVEDIEASNEETRTRLEKSVKAINTASKHVKRAQLYISNISFELWLLLHKSDMVKKVDKVNDYLPFINKNYRKKFDSLCDYKQQKNLYGIIQSINLDDVKRAVKRARMIRNCNTKNNSHAKVNINGFEYFSCNPDLSVHELVRDILYELGIEINT